MAGRNRGRISAGKRRKNDKKNEYFFDYTLLFIVLFLVGFGLVMIYSSSSYMANLKQGNPAYYFWKQFGASVAGLVLMIFVSFYDYHRLRKWAAWGYFGSMILICLVKTPLGMELNGARRWIKVAGISVQPAEIAKLAVILALATLICGMGNNARNLKGMLFLIGIAAVPALMILLITNNMSSMLIVLGIMVVMIFVEDYDYRKYLLFAGLGVLIVVGIVMSALNSAGNGGGFRSQRIAAWLDPMSNSEGVAFQTIQALYAIGSGGIFGKGLGQSMQKLGFLPEAQNDMIFSIICEELGLFGAFAVIILFVMLIWRCMVIANNAPDLFGALLTVGVMGHLSIQVILNVAVVTNSIPNTGISLPFISYGGTSVLFLLGEMGIVLNVSRSIRLYDVG